MTNDYEERLHELDKRNEEKIQELARNMMNKMPLFIAIGIAIFWIFYGTVQIYPTELSIVDRIAVTICTVLLAVSYCDLIAIGGFKSGKESLDYKIADEKYEDATNRGITKKNEIDEYALDIAVKNLKDLRAKNLEANGLRYKDFFLEDGEFIAGDYKKSKKLRRKQKRIIKKCIRARIIMPELFGEISSSYFGTKKQLTQKQFQTKTSIINTAFRLVVSIASVGFMFRFMGFSVGSMIYALFQIVMWTASGFSQRLKNFNFVKDTLVPQIKEKTLIINGYLNLSAEERKPYEDRVKAKMQKLEELETENNDNNKINSNDKVVEEEHIIVTENSIKKESEKPILLLGSEVKNNE